MLNPTDYEHLLHPGEIVLWSGRPQKRFPLTWRDGLIFLLILIPLALIVIFTGQPNRTWEELLSDLSCMLFFPLCFVCIFMLIGLRRVRQESYLLTDRRAMILVQGSKGLSMKDVKLLRKVKSLRAISEGRGCASIYLGPQTRFEHYSWLFVPDGKAVAEIIRQYIPAKEK